MKKNHNLAKIKLQRNDKFAEIQKLEDRISNNMKQIYNFQSYIKGKTRDMNYEELKEGCVGLLDQMNNTLVQRASFT